MLNLRSPGSFCLGFIVFKGIGDKKTSNCRAVVYKLFIFFPLCDTFIELKCLFTELRLTDVTENKKKGI